MISGVVVKIKIPPKIIDIQTISEALKARRLTGEWGAQTYASIERNHLEFSIHKPRTFPRGMYLEISRLVPLAEDSTDLKSVGVERRCNPDARNRDLFPNNKRGLAPKMTSREVEYTSEELAGIYSSTVEIQRWGGMDNECHRVVNV